MAKNNFFQAEFDRLATNGVIGDPDGLPAYCYLRVSDDSQSDEADRDFPARSNTYTKSLRKRATEFRAIWCSQTIIQGLNLNSGRNYPNYAGNTKRNALARL